MIERAVALADATIEPEHLDLDPSPGASGRQRGALRSVLWRVERDLIAETLAARHGNVSAAARELGIARQQLQRLISRHGLADALRPAAATA